MKVPSVWSGALAMSLALVGAGARQDAGLASFYVERNHFATDLLGAGETYSEILDIVPERTGVRARLIHAAWDYMGCDGGAVAAVERIVPGVTAGSLAGQDLCALTSTQVDR